MDDSLYAKGREYYLSIGPEESEGKVVVESSEGLSGGMFEPGPYELLADRIRSTCPRATALLMIRNQTTMLESLYKQYVKERGELGFDRFLNDVKGTTVLEKIAYVNQVKAFSDRFDGRLKVFLFEMLRKDRDGFVASVCRELGVKPLKMPSRSQNRGSTVFNCFLYRRLNFLCRKSRLINNNRKNIRHVLDFMDNKCVRHIDHRKFVLSGHKSLFERYRETNHYLSEMISMDLREYGYP